MSNTPRQPADPPSEGAGPADDPTGRGIPAGQHDHAPASTPDAARHDTETAPSRIEADRKP